VGRHSHRHVSGDGERGIRGPELAHLVATYAGLHGWGLMKGFAGRCCAVSRCSVVAVAAAGLLLPERFSRCCPQPGDRSGDGQGVPGGHPRPAPLHGPGHPGDSDHGVLGFAGDREHRQPPRPAQAPPHAEDHPHGSRCKFVLGGAGQNRVITVAGPTCQCPHMPPSGLCLAAAQPEG
jgi:hypothetical protein